MRGHKRTGLIICQNSLKAKSSYTALYSIEARHLESGYWPYDDIILILMFETNSHYPTF